MSRKTTLAVVPALGSDRRLERFHGDALENPLYAVVTWSVSQPPTRTRQLAVAGRRLLELQRAQAPSPDARSWFVGNDVQQDGSVLVLTPLDPLFVLLASAWRQRARAMALSDLLAQDHNSWLLEADVCSENKVRVICDVQQGDGSSLASLFVTANEAKILTWLRAKVVRVAETLALQASEKRAQSHSGDVDANFVLPGQTTRSNADDKAADTIKPLDPTEFMRDAVELVADYLPDEVKELLYKELRIEKQAPATKQAAAPANPHESFQRFDRRLQEESSGAGTKRTPSSANAAAAKKKSKLANVDRTGMKSLTSFFGKK